LREADKLIREQAETLIQLAQRLAAAAPPTAPQMLLDSESAPPERLMTRIGHRTLRRLVERCIGPGTYGLCPRSPVGGVRNCGVGRKRRALGHSQRMFVPRAGKT
jgi:hypothetical protein